MMKIARISRSGQTKTTQRTLNPVRESHSEFDQKKMSYPSFLMTYAIHPYDIRFLILLRGLPYACNSN